MENKESIQKYNLKVGDHILVKNLGLCTVALVATNNDNTYVTVKSEKLDTTKVIEYADDIIKKFDGDEYKAGIESLNLKPGDKVNTWRFGICTVQELKTVYEPLDCQPVLIAVVKSDEYNEEFCCSKAYQIEKL